MQRWRGLADVPAGWGRSVVTIGVFDGVHRGHQYILNRAVEVARALGHPMVVVTFDPHPSEVVRPGSHPALLCTASRRAELLAGLGANAVCILPFTPEFSRLSPEEFVRTVLVDRLHTAAVVVGENFRFGHRAAGDVAQLAELGGKYDFTVEGMPLLGDGGARISSRKRPYTTMSRHAPWRNQTPRSRPSWRKPIRSRAFCSAMFSASVWASSRWARVNAKRCSTRSRCAAVPSPRPRYSGSRARPIS